MEPNKKIEYLEKICKKYFLTRYSILKGVSVNFNFNEEYLPDYTITFKIDKKQFIKDHPDIKDTETKKTFKIITTSKTSFNIELISDFSPFDQIEIIMYKLADSIGIDGEFVFGKAIMV